MSESATYCDGFMDGIIARGALNIGWREKYDELFDKYMAHKALVGLSASPDLHPHLTPASSLPATCGTADDLTSERGR